jgi:hypothetical protein
MSKEKAFYDAAKRHLGKTTGLTRQDILAVGALAKMRVPRIAWKNKPARNVFSLEHMKHGAFDEKTVVGDSNILQILDLKKDEKSGWITFADGKLTIVERGPRGQFQSPSAETLNKILMQQVEKYNPHEGPKQPKKSAKELFEDLADLTQMVAKGTGRSLVAYGGSGVGKSWTVIHKLEALGLKKNKDFFVISGKITTASLYQTLFMHRKNTLIVFDDCDSAFDSDDSAQLLKAALDSYDKRTITWLSTRTINVGFWDTDKREKLEEKIDKLLRGYTTGADAVSEDDEYDDEDDNGGDDDDTNPIREDDDEDPEEKHLKKLRKLKYPSEFDFESRVIFISNLTDFDSAILSRSFKINMTLDTEQIFDRIESMIAEIGDKNVPVKMKKEVLAALREKAALGQLVEPNMRTFVAACQMVADKVENWERKLQYT